MVYKIGITGGIASGKSSCLAYLRRNPRFYTINLDTFANDIYKLNHRTLANISNFFGPKCVESSENGALIGVNRTELGKHAFKSKESL